MPGLDQTGPMGQGPLTGRGLGPCGRGLGFRRGLGRGFGMGFGRGFRWRAFAPITESLELTKEEEKKILEAEMKELETEKKEIEKRLKELK